MKTKKGYIFRVVTKELEPEQLDKIILDAFKVFNKETCEYTDLNFVEPEDLIEELKAEWDEEEGVRNSV